MFLDFIKKFIFEPLKEKIIEYICINLLTYNYYLIGNYLSPILKRCAERYLKSELDAKDKIINDLKNKLKIAEEKFELKGQIVFESPFYFRYKDNNKFGPYCKQCYESDGKEMSLIKKDDEWDQFYCTNCKESYEPPESMKKRRDNIKKLSQEHRNY